jgi:hypothetical protein
VEDWIRSTLKEYTTRGHQGKKSQSHVLFAVKHQIFKSVWVAENCLALARLGLRFVSRMFQPSMVLGIFLEAYMYEALVYYRLLHTLGDHVRYSMRRGYD